MPEQWIDDVVGDETRPRTGFEDQLARDLHREWRGGRNAVACRRLGCRRRGDRGRLGRRARSRRRRASGAGRQHRAADGRLDRSGLDIAGGGGLSVRRHRRFGDARGEGPAGGRQHRRRRVREPRRTEHEGRDRRSRAGRQDRSRLRGPRASGDERSVRSGRARRPVAGGPVVRRRHPTDDAARSRAVDRRQQRPHPRGAQPRPACARRRLGSAVDRVRGRVVPRRHPHLVQRVGAIGVRRDRPPGTGCTCWHHHHDGPGDDRRPFDVHRGHPLSDGAGRG